MTNHLIKSFYSRYGEVSCGANFSCVGRKKSRGLFKNGNFIFNNEIIVNFLSLKLVQTYYQCLDSAITDHFDRLFLFILTLKTKICVMALLILA